MKTVQKFTGFSQATFDFFAGLKENNYKPWFEENRTVYETEVLQPLKALALAMTPAMYSIDSQMDLRPKKVISRIYRDVRFSHDKSPYKTNMWLSFQRAVTDWLSFPGFYLEITHDCYQYGMGLYAANKKTMDDFRAKIENEPENFIAIAEHLITKHNFTLGGDEYKRPVKNDMPEFFQKWIQRKSMYLYKTCPVGKEMFDEGFTQYLFHEYVLLQPLYSFLVEVCGG